MGCFNENLSVILELEILHVPLGIRVTQVANRWSRDKMSSLQLNSTLLLKMDAQLVLESEWSNMKKIKQ